MLGCEGAMSAPILWRLIMANITRFDPFNDLVDDLFRGYFVRPMALENAQTALVRMKVDVTESNGGYVVHAEMPGVKKEDISVSIDGAQVTYRNAQLDLGMGRVKQNHQKRQQNHIKFPKKIFGELDQCGHQNGTK